jgi:hypothetical protein
VLISHMSMVLRSPAFDNDWLDWIVFVDMFVCISSR